MLEEKIDWKDEATSFAIFIQGLVKQECHENINPTHLAIVRQGIKVLHESFDGIADVLGASRPNRADEAFMHVRALMASAFILRQSSVLPPR